MAAELRLDGIADLADLEVQERLFKFRNGLTSPKNSEVAAPAFRGGVDRGLAGECREIFSLLEALFQIPGFSLRFHKDVAGPDLIAAGKVVSMALIIRFDLLRCSRGAGIHLFLHEGVQYRPFFEPFDAFKKQAVTVYAALPRFLEQQLPLDQLFQEFLSSFCTRVFFPDEFRDLRPPQVEFAGGDLFSIDDGEGFARWVGFFGARCRGERKEKETEDVSDGSQ